jgi:hypothetical protein
VIAHLDKAGESLSILSNLYTEDYPELHNGFAAAVDLVAVALRLVSSLDDGL